MWNIIDGMTNEVVGTAKTFKGAARSAERRNNAYGRSRYYIKNVGTAAEAEAALDLELGASIFVTRH